MHPFKLFQAIKAIAFTALFPLTSLIGQEKIGELALPHRKISDLNGMTDSAGLMCVFFTVDGTERDFFVLSPKMEVINKFWLPFGKDLLGIKSFPDRFCLYFETEAKERIEVVSLPKDQQKAKTSFISLALEKGNKELTSIADQNEVFTVFKNMRLGNISVYRFDDEKNAHKTVFPVSGDLINTFSSKNYLSVKTNGEHSIESAKAKFKIYLEDKHKIILTSDDEYSPKHYGVTKVMCLDLETSAVMNRNFSQLDGDCVYCSNSFYYDKRLYRLILNEILALSVFDVESNVKLKHFEYGKSDSSDLIQSRVIRVSPESFWHDTDSAVVEGSRKILRKLRGGEPAISVQPLSDHSTHILIGSYVVPSSGGGGGFSPGSPGISTPYGSVPATSGSWSGGFGFGSNGGGISTFFKTSLDSKNYEISPLGTYRSKTEIITNFIAKNKDPKNQFAFPGLNHQFIFGYQEGKEMVLQFYRY